MRKNLLMLVVTLLTTVMANAETTQSACATLNHEGTVTIFMGGNGLKEAHDAAVDGDAIVLSPGTFNAVNISKAITLRGAGAALLTIPGDTIKPEASTYINGNVYIDIAASEGKFTIEGCDFNNEVYFHKAPETNVFKTRIAKVSEISNNVKSIDFVHCLLFVATTAENMHTSMLNTVAYYDYYNPAVNATNCALLANKYNTFNYYSSSAGGGKLLNCIIIFPYENTSYHYTPMSANFMAYNCVACTKKSFKYSNSINNFFQNCSNGSNRAYDNLTMFNEEDKVPSYPFILTDQAQQTYLGNDGTQVGVHGGALPMDPIPDNLLVTKCNIAPRTTPTGKLSIEIQVSTAK